MKTIDTSVSEDVVKNSVKDFLAANAAIVEKQTGGSGWSQTICAWCLAKLVSEVFGDEDPIPFKSLAKFLSQDTLHGLSGNSSQFKTWYFGKDAAKQKASVSIDDLA